jgi:hypothetical protein
LVDRNRNSAMGHLYTLVCGREPDLTLEEIQGCKTAREIFEAWSDEEWAVDGADVRVSLICFGEDAR